MESSYIKPMLAKRTSIDALYTSPFESQIKYVQPKLNGIRAIWNPKTKKLQTRNGIEITSCPHIINDLPTSPNWLCLDGEIYCHNMPFSQISGLSQQAKSSKESKRLSFNIFDSPIADKPCRIRLPHLDHTSIKYTKNVKKVETFLAAGRDGVDIYYKRFLAEGYEGVIIRDPEAEYEFDSKGYWMLKIKPESEMEAVLIGFKEPCVNSKNASTFGSLILETKDGLMFGCSGLTNDERTRLWKEKPIGQKITVKYDYLSDKGIPLMLRYKAPRWDI